MSNTFAIDAVTIAVRNLLQSAFSNHGSGVTVTTLPPERAQRFGRRDRDGRINLYLYSTIFNQAVRSGAPGDSRRAGATTEGPVGLDLCYLLSAHERNEGNASSFAHRWLGQAMRVLHDQPVLNAAVTSVATSAGAAVAPFADARIIPQSLTLEDLSRLWAMFQSPYRISAGYRVAVQFHAAPPPIEPR